MCRTVVGVIGLLGAFGGSAMAAPMAGPDVEFYPLAVAASPSQENSSALDDLFFEDALISEEDLVATRGGVGVNDVQINNATTNGNVSDVSADNSITGAITGTQLNDVSGTNVVMVNSGNGVVMQSITEINIILHN